MLISVEQIKRLSCGFRVGHPLGNYFLQNDVQFWCPYFLIEGLVSEGSHSNTQTNPAALRRLLAQWYDLGLRRRGPAFYSRHRYLT